MEFPIPKIIFTFQVAIKCYFLPTNSWSTSESYFCAVIEKKKSELTRTKQVSRAHKHHIHNWEITPKDKAIHWYIINLFISSHIKRVSLKRYAQESGRGNYPWEEELRGWKVGW